MDGELALFDFDELTPASVAGSAVAPAESQAASQAADASPLPAWARRLAVFDLETTGVDVDGARIVTAFIGVLGPDGAAEATWSWLADPGIEIPESATAVHGITTAHARAHGAPAAGVVAEIVARLTALFDEGLAVVAYNAPYDFSVLQREARRHGVAPISEPTPVIDPLVLDRHVDRYRKGKRTLGLTTAHYGVPLEDAHDASADAIAAGRVAQAIALAHAEHLDRPAADLHDAQVRWADAQAAGFEDWMRRTVDPEFVASTGWPIR